MRIFIRLWAAFFLISFGPACQNQSPTGEVGKTAEMTTTTPPAGDQIKEELYPSLPPERMQELYNSVDYIDFVFYYANFSMNQSDANSIKATLAHVASEVPDIDPSCQPIGSLFFQSKGQELIQAELFYTEKCVFYIWLVNGKRTYANKMTPNGFQFYKQIFSQGTTAN